MKVYRRGNSYRAAFQGGAGRDVLIGLVPATSRPPGTPRLIALPRRKKGAPDRMDPARVLEAVMRALREVEATTGVRIAVEAIEYVPDDGPHCDLVHVVARAIGDALARDRGASEWASRG